MNSLALRPGLLLRGWLIDLISWNCYAKSFFNSFESLQTGFTPYCLFEKGTGTQILAQFCRLQAYLRENRSRDISAGEVLQAVISMEFTHLEVTYRDKCS